MTSRILSVAVSFALVLHANTSAAQPPRDYRTPGTSGTATITGVVLSDDRDSRPLRRARVTLSGSDIDVARVTITADDGRFIFEQLPQGRYTITAAKDAYVSMSAGADRPERPGLGIEVRAGQTAQTSIRLPRGAVITGIVRLPTGEPAAGFVVGALLQRYVPNLGERRLSADPNTTATTDDRGVYRIFGLPAGTYIVGAAPPVPLPPGTDLQVLSDTEIKRALSEVKEQIVASRPGMLSAPPSLSKAADPPRGGVTFAPIYYPGTPSDKQAAPIALAAGETRTGIDIDLEYVRTATVTGFVTAPPEARVQVMLANADGSSLFRSVGVTATPMADGAFSFRSLPPGHYAISARATALTAQPGAGPAEMIWWGRTEVIVSGEDLSAVTLALKPALTLSGQVVFKGNTPPPPLPTLKLPIPAGFTFGFGTQNLPNVTVQGNRFMIPGAIPGVYRLRTQPPGIRTPIGTWWLESVAAGGRELLDSELDLQNSVDDAVITFSDRASELSGWVGYVTAAPFREGLVLVFSTNRQTWFLNSRRVAAIAPDKTGRYVVRNLPSGEYFVTVAVGLERNEWFDPEVLASLARSAQRVTISGVEAKTHDLILK